MTRGWMPPPVSDDQARSCESAPSIPDGQERLRELQALLDRTREELRHSRAEAEAARQANERFLSSVSHELRTPLSAILLWTTLIEEEKIHEPEQLREALEAIKRSAEEQQALIENLVDTTRLVLGRLRLDRRTLEIAPIVCAALEGVRAGAQQKQLSLHHSVEPAPVSAPVDRARLQQALTHLLLNAVRFTPAGGRVQIDARLNGRELQIAVGDSGPGVAAEKIPHLFTGPTSSLPKAPRTEAGLGYGLLVATRIIEMHGGTLAVGTAGELPGATFIIRLPLDAAEKLPPMETAPAAGRDPRLTGRHVLLVTHDPDARQMLAAAFCDAGADVTAVDSAPAATEAFERRRPDVIVCDVALPTIDAGALLRDVRQFETGCSAPHAPALALANDATGSASAAALGHGFDHCLSGPIDPARIVTAVAESLRLAPT